mgnify:CR=1 FL=1
MKQFLLSLLSLLLLCVGCGTIELPDGPSQSGTKHKVIVHTRAADNVVPTYPVEVLAFDAAVLRGKRSKRPKMHSLSSSSTALIA